LDERVSEAGDPTAGERSASAPPRTDADVAALLTRVRLVVSDFDGVMTDNRVLVFDDGREAVMCSRADGQGCELLRHAGVEVVILSTERNPVVSARAAKLRVEAIQDCPDKGRAMRELRASRGLERAEVAYIGNDVNDLPAFAEAGMTIAPCDAHRRVRDEATVVTSARGGEGVLREVAELLVVASRAEG
jgi:3-deoxy-D-manno-octulosonate 8-phosphate phosphatase (KDO 8-P phosphatase)